MITATSFEDALCGFLQKEVAEKIILGASRNLLRKPQIAKGYILPKENHKAEEDYKSEFPFICTRLVELKNKDASNLHYIIRVKIIFGVHCEGTLDEKENPINDGSGYRDIWNLIEKTRLELMSKRTIDNRYRLNMESIKAEIPEEQPYPYWEGWIISDWDLLVPVVERRDYF